MDDWDLSNLMSVDTIKEGTEGVLYRQGTTIDQKAFEGKIKLVKEVWTMGFKYL